MNKPWLLILTADYKWISFNSTNPTLFRGLSPKAIFLLGEPKINRRNQKYIYDSQSTKEERREIFFDQIIRPWVLAGAIIYNFNNSEIIDKWLAHLNEKLWKGPV